ncbi:MAG: MarR family winged helix-turn-helix transcriptional regulator [Eubacteriales bacterium]|nr:MarR family winged helix-turn-helix transcriptional regulator [Eubacteriales bacterium]
MVKKREVIFVSRMLLNQTRRLTERRMQQYRQITPMQGHVIGYVKHHPEVYQRDLEKEFQIRRSTASAILQTMEKNDLIRREPVPHDARLKKLVLTPKAEAFSEQIEKAIASMEAVVTKGVSQEELDNYFATVEKFENNLKEYIALTEKKGYGEETECSDDLPPV